MLSQTPTIERRAFVAGAAALAAVGAASAGLSQARADEPSATGASLHTWEVAPDPIDPADIVETVDADIVIVGAGIAGMAAFMWAAEGGAKTVIIEKLDTYSGRGLDFGAVDTKIQREAGIEIDKGALINDLVKASGYKADGSLIRLWANHSGVVFDRLIDMTIADGGAVMLGEGSSVGGGVDFVTRTYPTDHMFGGMVVQSTLELIGRMEKAGIEAGGESRYETKGEQLVVENGRVVGVIASTAEGYVRFNATNGVILATGDYGGNPEMVKAWCPLVERAEASVYTPAGANTGDGLNMAMWIGGTIQSSAHAAMVHPIFGGGALSSASFLKVNNSGVRFCNENTTLPGISNMYMTSANCQVWTIFDSDYDAQMAAASELSNYNNNTSGPLTQMFMTGVATPDNMPTHADVIEYCLADGSTLVADTLEELAEQMGVDAETFSATVARYNELVDAGVDEDFGKNPEDLNPIKQAPFYASRLTAKLLVICSGLNVNSRMQVLGEGDAPIEGLYAVGNVMGNYFANDYPICAPGQSHGRCLTLGALIGDALATGTELGANF